MSDVILSHEREPALDHESSPFIELESLFVRSARADEEEAKELFSRFYSGSVDITLGFLRIDGVGHDELQDVSQEVYIKLWRAKGKYEPNNKLAGYLRRVCSNAAIDHHRRRFKSDKRRANSDTTDLENLLVDENVLDRPDTQFGHTYYAGDLDMALQQVPGKYVRPLALACLEDMTYCEVAETEGIHRGTVKSRIHRAKGLLRAIIEESAA